MTLSWMFWKNVHGSNVPISHWEQRDMFSTRSCDPYPIVHGFQMFLMFHRLGRGFHHKITKVNNVPIAIYQQNKGMDLEHLKRMTLAKFMWNVRNATRESRMCQHLFGTNAIMEVTDWWSISTLLVFSSTRVVLWDILNSGGRFENF